jgi:hypothetical protein
MFGGGGSITIPPSGEGGISPSGDTGAVAGCSTAGDSRVLHNGSLLHISTAPWNAKQCARSIPSGSSCNPCSKRYRATRASFRIRIPNACRALSGVLPIVVLVCGFGSGSNIATVFFTVAANVGRAVCTKLEVVAERASGATAGTYTTFGLADISSMGTLTTSVSRYVTPRLPPSITATRDVNELSKLGNAGIALAGFHGRASACATSLPFISLVLSG